MDDGVELGVELGVVELVLEGVEEIDVVALVVGESVAVDVAVVDLLVLSARRVDLVVMLRFDLMLHRPLTTMKTCASHHAAIAMRYWRR